MSGAELIAIGPIIGVVMKLLVQSGLNSANLAVEARAMDMIADNVKDDIEDARMFYDRLTKHFDKELQLKRRVLVSIHKAEFALNLFQEYLEKHKSHQALGALLGDRAKVKRLMAPLQASQSQLARRIDWMRSALSDLDKNPNPSKEEGDFAWSVPPNERPGWVGAKEDRKE